MQKVNFSRPVKSLMSATLCTAMLFSIIACSSPDNAPETAPEIPVAVSAQKANLQSISSYISLPARLEAANEIMVTPRVAGTVTDVMVEVGQEVREGDILFYIDDADMQLAVGQADAALQSARANYDMAVDGTIKQQLLQLESGVKSAQAAFDTASLTLERTKALFDMGGASKQALEGAQMGYDMAKLQLDTATEAYELTRDTIAERTRTVAQAGLSQAQVAASMAQRQLDNTAVRSEIDGVVSMRKINPGMSAAPGVIAMSVVDDSSVVVSVEVPDTMLKGISNGSRAIVIANDREYQGEVETVSPAASNQTMLFPVRVRLDNSDKMLKVGMYASVRLVVEERDRAFTVPLNAVFKDGDNSYIFVAVEGRAVKTRVETGISNEDRVEITAGINEGDMIIVKGGDFLEDQSAITVS